MQINNEQDRKRAEVQIQQLFAQCQVPKGKPDARIGAILKQGLYELSLCEVIEFSKRVLSTGAALFAAMIKSLKKGSTDE